MTPQAQQANEKKILAITSASHYMTHLFELFFPAVALTIKDDLGWSFARVLQLSFLMYLLFGLGALPAGYLTDRWRAQWVLSLSMLGAALGAFCTALSQTPMQITLSLALIGISLSAYHPAGMSLISRTIRRRGKALGINGVFGNLGSATAPFVAGIIAYQFGWRVAYAVLGGVGLCVAWWCFRVRMHEEPYKAAASVGVLRANLVPWFAILCLAMLFAGFSYRGVSLILPANFKENTSFLTSLLERFDLQSLQGIGNLSGAMLASAVYGAGMLGQVAGGHLADRYDLRKLYLLFHAFSLPFLVGMAFLHESWLLISSAIYIFFSLGMQPIENSLVARLTPERWRSTSYGIKFILNFGVGSLAVYAVAALQKENEFSIVFGVMAGMVGLVVVASLGLLYASRRVHISNREE